MALVVGTNSYVSVFEANDYYDDRLGEEWREHDMVAREKAIITASQIIDKLPWNGVAVSATQKLAWPRVLRYVEPNLRQTIEYDGTETEYPERVKESVYILALHLLENVEVLTSGASVQSLQAGSVGLTTIKAPPLLPQRVLRLLDPLVGEFQRPVFVGN